MSAGRKAVHERRARLLDRSARERDELAGALGEWQRPLGIVDGGLAIVRGIRRSAPLIGFGAGLAAAGLAFIRPDSIGGWIRGGQAVWRALTGGKREAARRFGPGEEAGAEGEQVRT